jgi:hypothetical protein
VWQRQAVRHGGKFLKHVIPAIIKPLHSLWNEVIGFFFLCFAVGFGFRMYRGIASGEEFAKLVLLGFFTIMMACFGISSFLKARRISRS